jgi:PAS domain S-box-containing protein
MMLAANEYGRIVWVNEAFLTRTGYRAAELIGRRLERVLREPDTDRRALAVKRRAVRLGRGFDVEAVCRSKSGAPFWARIQAEPVFDGFGELQHYVASLTDISEMKEQKLRITEALLFARSSLDALSAHVAIVDRDGVILQTNRAWRAFAELNGAVDGFDVGSNYLSVCQDSQGACCREALRVAHGIRAVLDGELDLFEMEYPCHSPTRQRWFVIRATRFPEGGPDCAVIAHEDVTEQKTAALNVEQFALDLYEANKELAQQTVELERARADADRANEAKSDFLAKMSHEIRTPMTAIMGFADLLRQGSPDPEQRSEFVDTIRRNGAHLLAILDDILDLSKIEAGRMSLELVPADVPELLGDAAALFSKRAEAKGLSFSVEAAGEVPSTVKTDPTRVRQVVYNLLGNAVKFTQSGRVTLIVGHDAERERLRFEVIDEGIGMSPEQVQRVFEPFAQADASMSRKYGGTGLGLSLSLRLAEMLGGSIEVISKMGEGSRFIFTCAASREAGADVLIPEELLERSRRRRGADGHAEAGAGEQRGRRVLVVEDGPDNRRLIAFHLAKAGFETSMAENGRLGVDAFHRAASRGEAFDVVLMDMQMPELDGYAATRELRAAGVAVPIIALTAHAMTGDREKCLAAGCDDYLTKPIERQTLLETIRAQLHAHRGPRADARTSEAA